MSARGARIIRAQRQRAAHARALEVDAAYEEARRAELVEVTVAGDETLGTMVDAVAASERTAAKAAAWKTVQVYNILKYTEANTRVTTSEGTVPWDSSARRAGSPYPRWPQCCEFPSARPWDSLGKHECWSNACL